MKRRELMKKIADHAKASGLDIVLTEGGSHTKIAVGGVKAVVPRHSEINEITAKAILKQIGVTS
jgi:mRNA interferase HicA